MTRAEEIDNEAYRVALHRDESLQEIQFIYFEKGAEWSDRTMLERMLRYLEVEHPTFFEHFGEEICKAMEE